MALRVDINRGLVLLTAVPYEETIVDWIRTLPERRYRPATQDWTVPARHEHLRTIWGLIGELEERGSVQPATADEAAGLARAPPRR